MKENYDEIKVRVEKGRKADIKAHADTLGESVNAFINRAIDHEIARDGSGSPQEGREGTSGAGVSLPSDTLEAARRAAEHTGEAPAEFMARAIETQARWDKSSFALGIDPVYGG